MFLWIFSHFIVEDQNPSKKLLPKGFEFKMILESILIGEAQK